MMNADLIGDPALSNRDNCTADDRHDHYARSISREGTEFCDAKRKNAGEHDRIEETDEDDAVHRKVPIRQHGNCNESCSADRADGEEAASFHLL